MLMKNTGTTENIPAFSASEDDAVKIKAKAEIRARASAQARRMSIRSLNMEMSSMPEAAKSMKEDMTEAVLKPVPEIWVWGEGRLP